jgi:RNA polymerase sigma-70 factor (sigma-E family)
MRADSSLSLLPCQGRPGPIIDLARATDLDAASVFRGDGVRRLMRAEDERDFVDLYVSRASAIRRTAFLLCGDWQQAEDLVQTAFTKTYAAWTRVRHSGAAEAYVRKVLARAYVDDGRRSWSRHLPVDDILRFDRPQPADVSDDRLLLLSALAGIPPRQRACLVLRFWEDCSVEETAKALGCRPGTVKSQTARGLETLRRTLFRLDTDPQMLPDSAAHGMRFSERSCDGAT